MRKGGKNPTAGFTRWQTGCGEWTSLRKPGRRSAATAGPPGWTGRHRRQWGVRRGAVARGTVARPGEGTYRPKAVRQVPSPKRKPGQFRPLGIPCIRDRVWRTSALPVVEPIFGAGPQPEQYAHRPERSATDAVKRIHRLVNTGHREVVDGDLSSHFGEIPHAGPMKSVARRVSDGRMPGLVKAWPGCRRRRTTGRAASAAQTAPAGSGKARRRVRRSRPAWATLHAPVHPGMEGAGPRPAPLLRDRQPPG